MASRSRPDAEVLVVGARPNPATLLMEPLWRRTGLPIPEDAIERELSGLRLSGPSGQGPLFCLRAFHLDRRVFDKSFAAMAAGVGAGVRGGVRVTGALPSGGVDTDSGPLRARVTIFADGARSAMREVLPTMRNPWEAAWGIDQLLEGPGLGESPHFEVRFGSFAPGWRTQFNPLSGDRASLWTFLRGVPQDELDSYAACAREVFPGARTARVLQERRGADPSFVVPGRIAGDGVMACGAAAAQGGLEYGARAGLPAGPPRLREGLAPGDLVGAQGRKVGDGGPAASLGRRAGRPVRRSLGGIFRRVRGQRHASQRSPRRPARAGPGPQNDTAPEPGGPCGRLCADETVRSALK